MYVCPFVFVFVKVCVLACVCMCACVCSFVRAFMLAFVYACVCVCVCVFVALSDRRGKLILVSTPKGMNNLFYDYFQKAQSNANWFLYRAKASETGIVEKEELKAALDVMGKDKYSTRV